MLKSSRELLTMVDLWQFMIVLATHPLVDRVVRFSPPAQTSLQMSSVMWTTVFRKAPDLTVQEILVLSSLRVQLCARRRVKSALSPAALGVADRLSMKASSTHPFTTGKSTAGIGIRAVGRKRRIRFLQYEDDTLY